MWRISVFPGRIISKLCRLGTPIAAISPIQRFNDTAHGMHRNVGGSLILPL